MSHNKIPPRPTVTQEMVRQVTDQICERHEIGDPDILPKYYRYPMEGLALAIELAKHEGWDYGVELDQGIVDDFYGIDMGVRRLINAEEQKWFEENKIEPPHPIGTRVQYRRYTGFLASIHERGAGKYLLEPDEGQIKHGGQLIVNFEDVELIDTGESQNKAG